MAVPATVVGACREILLTPMLMTTGTKTMECLLRIAHRRFGIIHPFGLGFPDVGNAEIHGFVANVTAVEIFGVRVKTLCSFPSRPLTAT